MDVLNLAREYPREGRFRAVNTHGGKSVEGRFVAVPGRFLLRIAPERSAGPPAERPAVPRPSRDAEIAGKSPENGETGRKSGRNDASTGSWKAERRLKARAGPGMPKNRVFGSDRGPFRAKTPRNAHFRAHSCPDRTVPGPVRTSATLPRPSPASPARSAHLLASPQKSTPLLVNNHEARLHSVLAIHDPFRGFKILPRDFSREKNFLS